MTDVMFTLASGSTIGRDHRTAAKNCQDGVHVVQVEDCTVGVVSDGCGSGQHSEVGAKMGARLVATAVANELRQTGVDRLNWQRVQWRVVTQLRLLAGAMGDDVQMIVQDYFLFTIVGVAIDQHQAAFFALGDGVVCVNGEFETLGPFPNNAPPYLGYQVVEGYDPHLAGAAIEVIRTLPTEELEHFLIGSDGVMDLIAAEKKELPGMTTPVGSLDQFWREDRYFRGNPDLVSRQLRLMSRDWPRREPTPGLLPDDTTFIVGRRNKPEDDLPEEE